MNYKSILFFLGIFSLFVSFFSILNIFYSIYFDFILGLKSYLITSLTSLFLGSIFCYIGYHHRKIISFTDQLFFLLISFLYVPLLISIPYYLSEYNISFLNSYFESVSGLTTTGFSIITNVETLDDPLLLWRSSSQWLGGLFFLIAIVGTIGTRQIKIKPAYLISSEASVMNFYNNFNTNFIRIFLIYFLSTIFIIFLYSLVNIRLLDGFNLAFTSVSSGGFITTYDLSTIINTNPKIFILCISLLFPILNFYLIFNIFTKKFEFKNHQEDVHIIIIIFILSLLFYFFKIPSHELVKVFLAIASSIATSGITTYSPNVDISLFLIILTIIGGSVISTSSGFKYVRFYILLKISYREIYKLVKPNNIFSKNLFNTESQIDDNDSRIAFLVFISFIISLFILSSILTFDNMSFENSFKLSILTLTNTVTSSLYGFDNSNFFYLNNITKLSLIVFMIFGKIEIIAILFLIKKFIFKE